jgi:hypothetical protein
MLTVFWPTFDDGLVNTVSGFAALLTGGLAACQICANEASERRHLAWPITTLAFSVLTISQWYEGRTEMIEQALRIENINDVLLLVVLPPALLAGLRAGGVFARWARRIVIVGICAQAVSTGMDVLDNLPKHSALSLFRTSDTAVDVSEIAFLELYLIGVALYTLGELKPRMGV